MLHCGLSCVLRKSVMNRDSDDTVAQGWSVLRSVPVITLATHLKSVDNLSLIKNVKANEPDFSLPPACFAFLSPTWSWQIHASSP
jgi:hypothetical protein